MATLKRHLVVLFLLLSSVAVFGVTGLANRTIPQAGAARGAHQERDGAEARRRLVFERPPADLDQIAALIPRGNVNATAGGHVRPVKHMYARYLVPRDGGSAAVDVHAMAQGEIVMVVHRQTDACVVPDHTVPGDCATGPGATAPIDEYEVFTRHTDRLTSMVCCSP